MGVVPGGAIHQVGGRDRNIYCRVVEGNQKPEFIRLLSTCLPIRSMAAEQTAEEGGGEGAGRDGVSRGPGLPLLWIWPESSTSTTGTRMRIFTLARTAPAAAGPGFRLHRPGMDWWRSPLLEK